MDSKLERLRYLIGTQNLEILAKKRVMICGIGGVGSFTAEALARSGIGTLILVDKDIVDITNLNRQLMTTKQNIGRSKVEVLKERIESISDCNVEIHHCFIDENFEVDNVDYVADCIDTLTAKMALVRKCMEKNIPIISALGSAKRLRAENICVTTLDRSKNDPLARNWRLLCKKERFPSRCIRVVYSDSPLYQQECCEKEGATRKERFPLGSIAFVVGAVGLKVAEVLYHDLLKKDASAYSL